MRKRKKGGMRKRIGLIAMVLGAAVLLGGLTRFWIYIGTSHPTVEGVNPLSYTFRNDSLQNSTIVIGDPKGSEGLVDLNFTCAGMYFGNNQFYLDGLSSTYNLKIQVNYLPFEQNRSTQRYNCSVVAYSPYNKTYNSIAQFNIVLLPLSNATTP